MDDKLIEQCLLIHRHRFHRRLKNLKRLPVTDPARAQGLGKLELQARDSIATVAKRQAPLPVSFPAELPISAEQAQVRELIAANQVLILCGETGSGKSTQLPKICLDMGRGVFGRIGHTQPRRIAARSLASRISAELDQPLGETVGYKVRFKEQVKPQTRVKLLTDGMLLAEIQQDKWLNEYDTLIIDEAHERSLNIDFLLGYLKNLLRRRKDLKLIVTSATIDPQRFSRHFNDAPVINVSGRTYPVEVRYREPEATEDNATDNKSDNRADSLQQAIIDAVDELSCIDRGDILVFLSGEREIRETAETLRKHKLQLTEILPLYARLAPAEQARIFAPSNQRRIVLATNVAETSLTVPGIRYVIDTGLARISRYSHRAKVQRLPIERISQASANQRTGRCGRVAAGVCIRLYGEDDFTSRDEFTEPEILRTNLATVILQMKVLHFGDIETFPFVEQPDNRLIKDGYRVLHEIGAVDHDNRVTHLGKLLAKLPVDPRLGRMLLEAANNGCLHEALIIVAALSIQDPRDRPMDKQQQADEAQQEFRHPESDFLGFVNLWQHLAEKRRHLSRRKFTQYCRQRFLSPTRVQEWIDIHHQLQTQLHEMGYRENEKAADEDAVHQSLLSGLLSHVGCRSQSGGDYLGARNTHFHLFPGSSLFRQQPKWLMAAELVETSRLYARNAARIDPRWVESLAGHLVKRSYAEPHWQKSRGQVAAYERVTLFGITLVSGRKVNYGPINPEEARELFIRFALVEGDFDTRAKFWRHNRELLEDVQDLEARSRRRDILVDPEQIYAFYAKRVPDGIYSKPQFESWLRKATAKTPKLLHMRREDLMQHDATAVTADDYPDSIKLGSLMMPLEYQFDPALEQDGVSLVVPVALINQVADSRGDWLVPGLLREKLVAMCKALPKTYRRQLVPIPDSVARIQPLLDPASDTPLVQQLGSVLRSSLGLQVPEDAWDARLLDSHLRMNYRVVDADGKTLATGKDLTALQQQFAGQAEQQFAAQISAASEVSGRRRWDFGEIPEQQQLQQAGVRMTGFPALVDEGDSVGLRVLDSRPVAEAAHRCGLLRLLRLTLASEVRYLKKNLPGLDRMRLQYAKVPPAPGSKMGSKLGSKTGSKMAAKSSGSADLREVLVDWILERVFLSDASLIRSEAAFAERLEQGKPGLITMANEACAQLVQVLDLYHQLRKSLSHVSQVNWMAAVSDLKQQLDRLVYQGFLNGMTPQRFADYQRYLKAMQLRLDKLAHAAPRDRQLMREMEDCYQRWLERQQAIENKGKVDIRLEEIRWMLEELRISLFAQQVKTAYPVSVKRINKRWNELGL